MKQHPPGKQLFLVNNNNITDPYTNLAIEEYLVRKVDCSVVDYLFLYKNEPCIVLGKNQSIYKEINFDFLRNHQLSLCRRISGGGTVYQDNGNLNFAFVQQFEECKVNNYAHFNKPVTDALNAVEIDAELDSRNNIISNGKKISGNAQFTNRRNIISHGTLLFDADLTQLRACLLQNDFEIESKAVGSVRSSVANINDISSAFSSIDELKEYLAEWLVVSDVFEFTDQQWQEIRHDARQKFESFAWVYGRSPRTVVRKNGFVIEIDNGLIVQITGDNTTHQSLIGVPYKYDDIVQITGELLGRLYF